VFQPESIANDNRRKSISQLFGDLLTEHHGEKISIRNLVEWMGSRGYGLLILLLDLPNLIPLPLPGLSAIFGIPMALIGLQMIFGLSVPWIPKAIANKTLDRQTFEKLFSAAKPYIEKTEHFLKPRMLFLTHPPMRPFLGLVIMILCGVLALPIPLGNLVLAVPIALIALGLIEKDGLFILCGIIGGALALMFNAAIVYLGVEAILQIFRHVYAG